MPYRRHVTSAMNLLMTSSSSSSTLSITSLFLSLATDCRSMMLMTMTIWLQFMPTAQSQLYWSSSAGANSKSVSSRPCLTTNQCRAGAGSAGRAGGHVTSEITLGSERGVRGSGEICYWLYEGCSQGVCMCDPKTEVMQPSTGKCTVVRQLGEDCDATSEVCSDAMTCLNGTCRCPRDVIEPSPLSSICLHLNHKLLDQRCTPSIDTCFHHSAYGYFSNKEVECHVTQQQLGGLCRCKEGYIKDGRSCRKVHIWGRGCLRDFYCEGGAICVDGECACPTGYRSVARNTKCAKIGATLELPLGAPCDEMQEKRYCGYGLVCHRCHDDDMTSSLRQQRTCVRYVPGFDAERAALKNAASSFRLTPMTLLMTSALFKTFIISSITVVMTSSAYFITSVVADVTSISYAMTSNAIVFVTSITQYKTSPISFMRTIIIHFVTSAKLVVMALIYNVMTSVCQVMTSIFHVMASVLRTLKTVHRNRILPLSFHQPPSFLPLFFFLPLSCLLNLSAPR